MQSLDERLRFAIINKRLVRITYHGAVRIGERHDYGIQRGAPKPLFYRLRRASDNYDGEEVTGWRLFTFRRCLHGYEGNISREPWTIASTASNLGRTVRPFCGT